MENYSKVPWSDVTRLVELRTELWPVKNSTQISDIREFLSEVDRSFEEYLLKDGALLSFIELLTFND